VRRKRNRSILAALKKGSEQTGQMWKMSGDQDVARFTRQAIAHPRRRIGGLQIACRRKLGQRVARTPEGLGSLLRSEFSAVPDDIGMNAAFCGKRRQSIDGGLADWRERPARIDLGTNSVAVVNEIQVHGVEKTSFALSDARRRTPSRPRGCES
jgi:hypothetical protein